MRHVFSLLFLAFTTTLASQTAEDERIAIQFYQLREFDKAEVLLKKLYDNNPSKYYEYIYKTYTQLRKYNEAADITKQMLKSSSKNLVYKYNLGIVYEKLRDTLQAQREWLQINEIIADNEYEANIVLQKYFDAHNWNMAEDLILKFQKRIKNKGAFSSQLMNVYVRQERMEEAVQLAFSQIEQDNVNYMYLYSTYEFLTSSKKAQRLMEKKVFAKLSTEPGSDKWNELAMQLSVSLKDYEQALQLAKAYEKRKNEQGQKVLEITEIAANEQEFDVAISGYDYILKNNFSGYARIASERKIYTVYAKIKKLRLRDSTNMAFMEDIVTHHFKQFGYNPTTAEVQLLYAEYTVKYRRELTNAHQILEKLLEIPMLPRHVISRAKLDMADIKLAQNDIWEASLLYGQVDKEEKDGPLGEEARFKNAKVFYFNGDYELAEDLLSILKSSTSELIANDALQLAVFIQENQGEEAKEMAMKDVSSAELLFYQNRPEEALKLLSSTKKVFPNSSILDDLLMIEANYEKSVENDSAAMQLYRQLYEKFPNSILADRAVYEYGKIEEERFQNYNQAKEAYLTLLTKYKDSVFTADTRKRLRKLRGETIDEEL